MVKEKEDELVNIWDIEEVEEEDTSKNQEEEGFEEGEEENSIEEEEENSIEESEEEEEEEEEKTDESEEESLISSIRKNLGYEDIEGEFEDTEEGLVNFTKQAAARMAEDYIDERFESNPIMKDFLQYVDAGGDPKLFITTKYPETDYSQLKFDEDNTEFQEKLVKEDLVASGYSGEELEAELEDIRNGGILESKARRALNRLKVKQQQEQEGLVEKQQDIVRQQEEQEKEAWDEIKNEIKTKNSLNGMRFPEADKTGFLEYLSKPVEKDKTQRDIKFEKMSLEDQLTIEFMVYKDMKLTNLIEKKAKDLNAKKLRDRLKSSKLDKRTDDRDRKTESATDVELDTL